MEKLDNFSMDHLIYGIDKLVLELEQLLAGSQMVVKQGLV